MQKNNPNPVLHYGSRKTKKFVRCYYKPELKVFRVEVELHSGLLHDISTLDDFPLLAGVILPKHFQVVDFDWDRLEHHLTNKFGNEGSRIIAGARRRSGSLHRVRRYLKRHGVVNVHRFLVPLAINEAVNNALDRWARHFKKGSLWVSTK
jgi:hypothetical protein